MTKEFISKLCAACDAVGGIEKKGKNPTQGYSYLRATDVTKAFRHELFERGIVVTQNETAPEYLEYRTSNDKRGLECRIAIEFSITDGESTLIGIGHGHAMDTSDKALYKAKTGALKYFLRGLGLIPDEKDDPEVDSPTAEYNREEVINRKLAELQPPEDESDLRWRQRIAQCATVEDFNDLFPDANQAPTAIKKWIVEKANACGYLYDKKAKSFFDPHFISNKFNEALQGSLKPPGKPKIVKPDRRISKGEEIDMHQARRETRIPADAYYEILGRYHAAHAKELAASDFEKALFDVLNWKPSEDAEQEKA